MAQINITLSQDEIMRLIAADSGEAMRAVLQEALNAILRAESDEQIGAARYERSEDRADSRNGTRHRALTTRIGTFDLEVPRHREAPFKTLLFENYKRSEAALVATMAEMVVAGVSTAKVGRVMRQLCGKSVGKSAVSEACKALDAVSEAFRNRPLPGDYLFVMLDATGVKVREDHRVCGRALQIAVGFTPDGRKEIIGAALAASETAESWGEFLESLKARGLGAPRMFTTDACGGMVSAIQRAYPGVPWQRCQAHFTRNIAEAAPKRLRVGLRSELAEMFNCPTVEAARARRDEILRDYAEEAPRAMEVLDCGFDDAMTVMELPANMRRPMRTTNYLERLNREVKRRTRALGIFPNAASVLRTMGAYLMEENDVWAQSYKVYYLKDRDELKGREARLAAVGRRQMELAAAA